MFESRYYIFENNQVEKVSFEKWAIWYQTANRKIEKTIVLSEIEVSTIFLSIDHNFYKSGKPILFETMIFGGALDGYQWRYTDLEAAKKGHLEAIKEVKKHYYGVQNRVIY